MVIKDGNVGIGTTTPGQKLIVQGLWGVSKDPDSGLSFGGQLAIKGDAPQLDFIDTNHNDWAIQVNSNKMYFIRQPWNTNDLVLDGNSGCVGIGTENPSAKLDIVQPRGNFAICLHETNSEGALTQNEFRIFFAGQAIFFLNQSGAGQYMNQSGAWNSHSDRSLKQDITGIGKILDKVMQLAPVSFRWRHNQQKDIGFVAQDVEEVFPELVSSVSIDGKDRKGLPYSSFGVLAIAAIQELARSYEQRIKVLEDQILALSAR